MSGVVDMVVPIDEQAGVAGDHPELVIVPDLPSADPALAAADHRRLEREMRRRFSPPLRPDQVERCVDDCVAQYEHATVRTYLSILVERAAVSRLRRLVAEVEACPLDDPDAEVVSGSRAGSRCGHVRGDGPVHPTPAICSVDREAAS